MKAIAVARWLHRDASMVSRLCAKYEAVRDLKREARIAEAVNKIILASGLEKHGGGIEDADLRISVSQL
jgi:hypothetical protein